MSWTNITNAQLAIGAPIRSIDLLALRDNITAQANGDAGAPKQQAAGINFGNGLANSGGALVINLAYQSIGSYMALTNNTGSATLIPNSNYSGGYCEIRGSDSSGTLISYGNASGTWRMLGNIFGSQYWLGVRVA